MSVTATTTNTLQKQLDKGDDNKNGAAIQKMKMGTMLTPLKKTYTGLASAAAHDLTNAAHGSSPAALGVFTLRVTAGAAAAGVRTMGDAGATPSATVATLSDDGKTITFEAGVTAFVVEYMPRSDTDMTAEFAPAS